MEDQGTLIVEKYKVLSVIAESNASKVCKVKLVEAPNTVFVMKKIKVETPENEARAKKELSHLQQFKHPRIVHLEAWSDSYVGGDHEINLLLTFYPRAIPALVYSGAGYPNCSFEDRTNVVKILRQSAEGLAFIHSQGFRHGDFRPGHVLLSDSYDAVITDFESLQPLSTPINSEADAALVTDPMYEKDPYRAPEIYKPKVGTVVDGKADVWSFGCVIYYLLFSKSPFKQGQSGVLVENIMAGKFEIPEAHAWPASYIDTMKRCLTVDLDQRLTLAELKDRLDAWEAPPAVAAPLPTPPPAAKKDNKGCVIN